MRLFEGFCNSVTTYYEGHMYLASLLPMNVGSPVQCSCHNGIVCSVGPILRVALLIHTCMLVHDLCMCA